MNNLSIQELSLFNLEYFEVTQLCRQQGEAWLRLMEHVVCCESLLPVLLKEGTIDLSSKESYWNGPALNPVNGPDFPPDGDGLSDSAEKLFDLIFRDTHPSVEFKFPADDRVWKFLIKQRVLLTSSEIIFH